MLHEPDGPADADAVSATAPTAAASSVRDGAGPPTSPRDDERSGRVLDAMESRLADDGIRSVVMSELAAELGMSTKTLYRLFPSKDALVTAVIDRWAERLLRAQQRRHGSDMSAAELVRTAAHFQVRRRGRLSPAFWSDLEADHPEAWARYRTMLEDGRRTSDAWMARAMRDDVDVQAARAMLVASIERVLDPSVRRPAGLSRSDAIDLAVDIWCRGVFVDPEAAPPPE